MRIHIEQAFGMLVARFGRFWSPMKFELARVPHIVEACLSLHNWCIVETESAMQSLASAQENQEISVAFRSSCEETASSSSDTGEGIGRI